MYCISNEIGPGFIINLVVWKFYEITDRFEVAFENHKVKKRTGKSLVTTKTGTKFINMVRLEDWRQFEEIRFSNDKPETLWDEKKEELHEELPDCF